jgi:hypothetical protein
MLLALLGAVAGLSGCLPSAPAIANVSPYKGQGAVAGDAPITVTFDRPMDHQSVEDRFEVRPGIPGCDRASCPLGWTGNTVTLSHTTQPFNDDSRYRVFIHPGYKDAAGRTNTVEHVWEFHTELPPTLSSATPSSGATAVSPDADISLRFSRALVTPTRDQLTLRTADGLGDPVEYHLTTDPANRGQLQLSPLTLLRPNTVYRLAVGDRIEDIHHNQLGKLTNVDFTTGAMNLTRSLAFAVRDQKGEATRIAMLRPPASLGAPAPGIRVLYAATAPIRSWGWSADAAHVYTLEGGAGVVMSIDLSTGQAARLPLDAVALAPSPGNDEIAVQAPDRRLRLWSRAGGEVAVPQAGVLRAAPSWSGDGRRLAAVVDDGGRAALAIIDRSTLSRFVVPDVAVAAGSPLSWSFDGGSLAFLRDAGPGKPPEVWIYHAVSSDGTALARVDALPATALPWSSDGASLYAATAPSDPRPLGRAPARPVAGQDTTFAPIRNTQPRDESPVSPSFDRRIAFIRTVDGQPQLWLINNDGSGLTQLTFATYEPSRDLPVYGVAMPEWAPGGGGG